MFLEAWIAQENFLFSAIADEAGQRFAIVQQHLLQDIVGMDGFRGFQDLVKDLFAIVFAAKAD